MIQPIFDVRRPVFDRRHSICTALFLSGALLAPLAARAQTPPPANLVRVCVLPAAGDPAAADLFLSAKDLLAAFKASKKDLAVVADPKQADVVVTVAERSVTVPRVAMGVVPMDPSRMPSPGPTREMHVAVTVAGRKDDAEFRNKNTALESTGGWKSADDDVAKQVEKWIAAHKASILAARSGG